MRVLLVLALVGTAFAAVPRLRKDTSQRVIGGELATIEEYPYMSNMEFLVGGIRFLPACGGSLITTTSVLSAAHCYIYDHHSQWRVGLGSSSVSLPRSVHAVSQLIIHERYNHNTIDNDVAIVKLTPAAILGSNIGLARIAGPSYSLPAGTTVYVAGWGRIYFDSYVSPEHLLHADVNIIDQSICQQRYGSVGFPAITDGMVCAGILDIGGKDACNGDSGGPLTYNAIDGPVLFGVVSWGARCADSHYPGVYARVSYYSDWIVANGSS